MPCFLSKDIIYCIHLHHHVLQRKTRGKAVPSTAQPKKTESSPKSNLQKYEYPPNTKWRHEEDSARLLCAIKKNQKLKIISPICRVPHLIGPFSQFRPDFFFKKATQPTPKWNRSSLTISLSIEICETIYYILMILLFILRRSGHFLCRFDV